MQITLISCVFPPEPVISAQTSDQLTRGLVSRGHGLTVLTSFPSRPSGKLFPGFKRTLYSRQSHPAGYCLIRCFSIPSAKSTAVSRLIENLAFGLTSAVKLAVLQRPDVIYSNSWPVFASGLMALVAGLRRIPYVLSVQDVYPESFSSQGRGSRSGLPYRVMRWIDRQIAMNARHIIVISDAFAEIYANDRGIPRNRITVVPNWVEASEQPFDPEAPTALRLRFSIPPHAFLVAYGGNIGVAAGVDMLVRAFQHTSPDVFGLIAGEGSELVRCQKLAGEIAPQKIDFFSPWPAEETMPLYQAADLLVLPTSGSQSMASVPSKMIRYMLSGRPILATGMPESDLARLINVSQCGWLIPPDNPMALAQKIEEIKNLPRSELEQRGQSGRRYALENLTSQACLPKIIKIIEEAAHGRNHRPADNL